MPLNFGLNVKSKAPALHRRVALDDDELDEDDQSGDASGPTEAIIEEINFHEPERPAKQTAPSHASAKNKSQPVWRQSQNDSRESISATLAAKKSTRAAEELDPSIFDYDSFHDAKAAVSEEKKAAARQDAIDRKPKYINNLLNAAARRKQDQQVAQEKLLQREREAEGDEFADKEKFVTGAYKQQQEETRRLEEQEKQRAQDEAKRKNKLGGGMQGFYRTMMDDNERKHQEAMEAAVNFEHHGGSRIHNEPKEKTDAEIAAEARARGVRVHTNEEGQITDKRELLSAGLNVGTSGRSADIHGADHLLSSNRSAQSAFTSRNPANQQAQRERQTRMIEEQLTAQTKRAREEEEAERAKLEKAAKSTKTEKDVSDAKARYLARKAAKERGEG